jgi:coenzyme PQQ precursor peptide PqqA
MPLAEGSLSVTHPARASLATPRRLFMNWSQPAFEDMRFGFEITMYISNR